ncbi:hypothetical protein C8R43DRAFT_960355 [Mycena crocata]|nr:hypothetical protein C8R43DRAFT_960355 [Mycena crocata]
MIVSQGGDSKGVPEPSAERADQVEPAREPSPPPAYSSSVAGSAADATVAAAGPSGIQIVVQHPSPELPSAFRPPSPSSFPHTQPHTRLSSSGPTPLLSPAVTPSADGYYAYYDPRSPYSIARADRRALNRFWGAFAFNIGILVVLWLLGFIQFG